MLPHNTGTIENRMDKNLFIGQFPEPFGNKIDKEIILQYQHPYRVLRQGGILLILVIVALIFGSLGPAVAAEEKADEEYGWEFQVAPYMWFLSMEGHVTVKGQKSDADLSFSDIWDELNIAGMVEFEGRKDRWGFFGDTIYANLGKDKSAQGVSALIQA